MRIVIGFAAAALIAAAVVGCRKTDAYRKYGEKAERKHYKKLMKGKGRKGSVNIR